MSAPEVINVIDRAIRRVRRHVRGISRMAEDENWRTFGRIAVALGDMGGTCPPVTAPVQVAYARLLLRSPTNSVLLDPSAPRSYSLQRCDRTSLVGNVAVGVRREKARIGVISGLPNTPT